MNIQLCASLSLALLAGSAVSTIACAGDVPSTSAHYVFGNQRGESSRVVGSSLVPPWKGYMQLSVEERRLVRSGFAALGENDEPPYPVAGTHAFIRAVQRDVIPDGGEGVLHVVASVSATGEVERVDIKSSPYPAMGMRLAALLKKSAFKPAICRGEPCAMEYPLRLTIAP